MNFLTFHRSLALHCARMIHDLYDGRREPNVVCRETDTQAFVERFEKISYVLFPGTASIQDWITDARVLKRGWFAGKVHAGFRQAYGSVAGLIQERLGRSTNIVVVGHSLGGALATLCAHDLAGLGSPPTEVFTFGAPRVGNRTFARDLNAKLRDNFFRIVNQRDPVPHVPWSFGTYRHAGTEIYLARDGTWQQDAPLWTGSVELAYALRDTLLGEPEIKLGAFGKIPNHSLGEYIRRLEEMA